MATQTPTIDEHLNERYDDAEKLAELMQINQGSKSIRMSIIRMLENGCFCPDCMYSYLGGD